MYSKDEMETLIRYDYATDTTYVSTNVKKHMTLFQKKGWTVTRQEVEDESVTFMEFETSGFPVSVRDIAKVGSRKGNPSIFSRKIIV